MSSLYHNGRQETPKQKQLWYPAGGSLPAQSRGTPKTKTAPLLHGTVFEKEEK
jgi:hypothetical protein